jgi:alkanesulfonate monooxygenase SsuD/methylene tetrahydromethanopterin reductase-like flavin-dependent oxidoreductase (luciferase family)
VEFGIFIHGYLPRHRRNGADAEHRMLRDELAVVEAAEAAGFKYAWIVEHHFLDEYSHMSANDVVLGYLAHATSRIHLGSGIFNLLPQVNHPAKLAERVAMLDHLSEGRFELGTGRGAGSYEVLAFLAHQGLTDMDVTREIWEDVVRELPKMWMQDTYEGHEGRFWSLPPRMVLPKPWIRPHPPMWYAAGSTSSYAMAARHGLGVLGFSVRSIDEVAPAVAAYKSGIVAAEPIGAFVNDNVMVSTLAFVAEDAADAVRSLAAARPMYLQSHLFRYHDTFPRPPGVPPWPQLIPDISEDMARHAVGLPGSVIGDPDDALRACLEWEATGVDQLVIGIGTGTLAETLETIRLLGTYVIPKLDLDPMHRTSRFRQAAGDGPVI